MSHLPITCGQEATNDEFIYFFFLNFFWIRPIARRIGREETTNWNDELKTLFLFVKLLLKLTFSAAFNSSHAFVARIRRTHSLYAFVVPIHARRHTHARTRTHAHTQNTHTHARTRARTNVRTPPYLHSDFAHEHLWPALALREPRSISQYMFVRVPSTNQPYL